MALAPVHGQTPGAGLPGSTFPAPIEPPRPLQPQPAQPSPLPLPPQPALPSAPPPPAGGATMVVRQFRFSGNTVFSDAELAERTARFLDRPVTFAELSEARNAITQLYIDRGYTTSGAFIPLQTSQDGTVEIRILEGRLGEVSVTSRGRLKPSYIQRRLRRAGGGVLNVPRLLRELRLLQANPLIETISADLAASPQPGVSVLRVQAVSARSFDASASMDNGRNLQTGSLRRGVDLSQANLLGITDVLSFAYRNSDGSNDTLVGYQLPLTSSDLTLNVSYRALNSWIIQPPLDELNITSTYRQWFAGLRLPLVQSVEEELALGISINKQDSTGLFLDGLPFPSRGVDPNGESRITTLSFNQDWIRRSSNDVLAIRSEVGIGLAGLDTTTPYDYGVDPDSPDASFLFWRTDGQYARLLGRDINLLVRTRTQLADAPLPSVEQFGLGGLGSVEGYQTNSLLTDSGLFATLELALPLLRWQQQRGLLQVVPFASIGYGWDAGQAPQPNPNLLSSVGVGLQAKLGDRFFGRVDYAQRLGPTPYQNSDVWQDQAVLFSIRYSP
ncbi:MAG: ShlB/FhaC/HecB family hemolysin secretion/activation protein [Cyanobacteriota bacterium]|nr:ShlB/FhaC/HecB family hemolysin secretion/activation protein [Cyanobacteriota bacterium]